MSASRWRQLAVLGQSVWYDNVARPALRSGLLQRIVNEDGVTGGTSNPSIFAQAVKSSDLYDARSRLSAAGFDGGWGRRSARA
jgi:transaldolase